MLEGSAGPRASHLAVRQTFSSTRTSCSAHDKHDGLSNIRRSQRSAARILWFGRRVRPYPVFLVRSQRGRRWSAGRCQGLASPHGPEEGPFDRTHGASLLPGGAPSGCARPMTAAAPPGASPRCRCRASRRAPSSERRDRRRPAMSKAADTISAPEHAGISYFLRSPRARRLPKEKPGREAGLPGPPQRRAIERCAGWRARCRSS